MTKVLHLTPHLGGGVGRALSGLIAHANASVAHSIACLEKPEKNQFIESIRRYGCEVTVSPSMERLEELVRDADILHLEWWNHPATIECLCRLPSLPVRLLIWSHVSGLYNPIIPPKLILSAHRFIFTSQCSFEAREVADLAPQLGERLGVVSSSGGFAGLPEPQGEAKGGLEVGYIGSLNFAKLHPRYVEFLAGVEIPGFKVKLIGDLTNRDELNLQCDAFGKHGMLDFRGYTTDIVSELASINVLAYLLNPEHYGTTENALLEAMAMGIVPVVLDNMAERRIVEDRVTGIIVRSPQEFTKAIEWLSKNPKERASLGIRAAKSVREKFTAERMEASLNLHYHAVMLQEKRRVAFTEIFGTNPAQWFLSCQSSPEIFESDGRISLVPAEMQSYGLFEKTKGTVFHFHNYFPNDMKLAQWAKGLETLQ